MNPITIFRGTSGLNTVADHARIPTTKSGINDVAEAVNITIDQYGRPSRRKGWSRLGAGNYHSVFCDGGDCFVASGGAIFKVNSDHSLTGIRSGMTEGAGISWKQTGDKTYYANGFERGYIENGVSYVWKAGEYHGPATNKRFTVPNEIKHLEEYSGRMFASANNVLWWSEPFRYDLFDLTRSFVQFSDKIRMIKSVDNGLFVGTDKNIYFLSGSVPSEFQLRVLSGFPAIEGSCSTDYVEGSDIGFQESGLCAVWASIEGAIIGAPSGQIKNLNKGKVIYPEQVSKGFGCMVGYHFIHGMK